MKRTCRQMQKQMPEALYNELDEHSIKQFQDHLSHCADCQSQYQAMQNTLKTTKAWHRPQWDEAYWIEFENKLDANLSRTKKASSSLPLWRPNLLTPRFKLAAGVICIFLAGLFIGRLINTQQTPATQIAASGHPETQTQLVKADAMQYIEQTKLILLGVTNTELSGAQLVSQQQLSQTLVNQSEDLTRSLEKTDQYYLHDLIVELNLILMQIANLENQSDLKGIEMIRSNVEHNAVLFKINMGEMFNAAQETPTPKQENKRI